jgi:hypothetical protein
MGDSSLVEGEGEELVIHNTVLSEVIAKGKACVVGKLIVDQIIRSKLIRGWKLMGSISFKVVGKILFLIEF